MPKQRCDSGVRTLLERGRAFQRAGRPHAAVEVFRAAAAHPAASPEPAFALCAALLRRGDAEAQTLLTSLLIRHPRHADGWEEIGAVLAEAGKREAALLCYARAFAAAPRFERAMQRGLLARALGRHAEAAAAFGDACRLNAGSARARFHLGLAAQDRHDLAHARDAYRAALALDPLLAEAAVNLGTVLQEQGDLDGARDAYRRAVSLRANTFGRAAQALATSPKGELWLDLRALRRDLGA